ncbi:MAG: crossover junction endodeoxyribonuclease RuvC [Myxococcota bacterium]
MLVLGIDPGSRYTGYGVVRKRGRDLIYVASGRVNAAKAGELPQRLPVIYSAMQELLREFEPDVAALESVFFAKNAMSSLKLGHARGVSMLACQLAEVSVHEYPPATVKQAVAGHGRADKDEVAQMVKMTLELEGDLAEDAADALAVAICHCQTAGFSDRLG